MKNIQYIIYLLATVFIVTSCGDSGIDVRLSRSDYFVSFDTKNAVFTSATISEGDTVVIGVVIGATRGASVTVEFDIDLPKVSDPVSAQYKLLAMDNTEMTDMKLVFPEGTGTQQFKFVPFDNDIVGDGTRSFTFKLLSNSAGYTIGIGSKAEASEYVVNVMDDDIWNPVGIGYYSSAAFGGTYEAEYSRSVIDNNVYKLIFFDNDVIFTIDPEKGTTVVEAQSLGEDIFGAGSTTWIQCLSGTYANGVCTFSGGTENNAFWVTSSLSGSGYFMTNEKFILPEGSYE